MSSLNALENALIDIRDRVTRERQFSHDSLSLALSHIDLMIEHHHKALQMLGEFRMQLGDAHGERDRMLSTILGNGTSTPPDTLDVRQVIGKRNRAEAEDTTDAE